MEAGLLVVGSPPRRKVEVGVTLLKSTDNRRTEADRQCAFQFDELGRFVTEAVDPNTYETRGTQTIEEPELVGVAEAFVPRLSTSGIGRPAP